MEKYELQVALELAIWTKEINLKPNNISKLTQGIQKKLNAFIPQKMHQAITLAIKNMVKAVLLGSTYTNSENSNRQLSLIHREALVKAKIDTYSKSGAAEGGITGAGGFVMSLADFPLLIGIKMKMLFEIAALYGYDCRDYRERLYILYIFQLTFSSKTTSQKTFELLENWENQMEQLPQDMEQFDWHTFQQEYRDYIDLAKLAQLLPLVGAAVGAAANYKLLKKLGKTAMMAYRMRMPIFKA